MSRCLEIGRAVLASSQQNIELWLTTLITISSPQLTINLEQLSSRYLLTLLSSGRVWIGRTGSTRIEIQLTLRGEPFPYLEFQDLLQSIVQAPVWSQLNLRLTSPENISPDDGVAHIIITDSSEDEPPTKQKCHRLLDNVSYADLQPPESYPRIELQAVQFSMDVLETRQRPQSKRSSTSQGEERTCVEQDHDEEKQELEDDMLLHEAFLADLGMDTANAVDQASVSSRVNKRKRGSLQDHDRDDGPGVSPSRSTPVRKRQQCRGSVARPVIPPTRSTPPSNDELAEIMILVERAMRLSIAGTGKSWSRVKIKANTILEGLSDIAPLLWRPGYLATLAQRARLLPTIGRSLGGAITARVTSVSLREKLRRLETEVHEDAGGDPPWRCPLADSESAGLAASIMERSWLHLQASLMARPTPPLQAFMNIDADAAERFDSNEILEDSINQQASDGIAPCFEKETDPTSLSNGKQDEAWSRLDFTVGTSVEHDVVASRTRTDSILKSSPSARVCHNTDPGTHCASLSNQTESHDGPYIRHFPYECSSRIDSCESTTSPTASHNDQNTATPIGARAGQSPAPTDDLLFEG